MLQHNPAILPVGNEYHDVPPNLDYWRLRWYADQVLVGDLAFLWYSNPNRNKRGIFNIAKIVSVGPHSPIFQKYLDLMWESDRSRYDRDALVRLNSYPSIIIERLYPHDFIKPCNVDELIGKRFHELPALKRPYQWGIRPLDEIQGAELLKYIQTTRPSGG